MERTMTHSTLDRVLKSREVEKITGLSSTTIWRERRRGTFPEPIRISPGRNGWRASDLATWIEDRRSVADK
jgi:prophage regulatory protein